MGRSVNYHSDAYKVLYTHFESGEPEDGEDYDPYQERFEWDSFVEDIENSLKETSPSLEVFHFNECHDREVFKIMENKLLSVWLSEYCGLVSISFVPEETGYTNNGNIKGIAERWIKQMLPKFEKALNPNLRKIGTFSNGESVFEKA